MPLKGVFLPLALLFGALAYGNLNYLELYLKLPKYPSHSEFSSAVCRPGIGYAGRKNCGKW
jgi:hypothetical protein